MTKISDLLSVTITDLKADVSILQWVAYIICNDKEIAFVQSYEIHIQRK